MDIETAHKGSGRSGFERSLAILAGLAAVLAALLATLQVDSSRRGDQAMETATRLAVQVFEASAATGVLSVYQYQAGQEAPLLDIESSAHSQASVQATPIAVTQQAIATAEAKAAQRLTIAAAAMSLAPGEESPVDAHT